MELFLPGTHCCKLLLTLALCGNPQILLLDKPTNSVNPALRITVWELLCLKAQGQAVLLTTHLINKAESLANRVAVLRQGNLRCYGTTAFLRCAFGLGYDLALRLTNSVTKDNNKQQATRNDQWRLYSVCIGCGVDDNFASIIHWLRPAG